MIKVALFDDNKTRREALGILLEDFDGLKLLGSRPDCRNAVAWIGQLQPDVVLMDIDMPYVNGIEGTQALRAAFPDLKIIIQTVFEDEDRIISAICAGADGYILKKKSPLKLIEGIKEVMEGGGPMTPIVARKVLKLFSKTGVTRHESNDYNLTKREQEILGLLVQGHSYKMIAAQLSVSYATVNSHINNIYKKLQVHSVAAAVSLALKKGLV